MVPLSEFPITWSSVTTDSIGTVKIDRNRRSLASVRINLRVETDIDDASKLKSDTVVEFGDDDLGQLRFEMRVASNWLSEKDLKKTSEREIFSP